MEKGHQLKQLLEILNQALGPRPSQSFAPPKSAKKTAVPIDCHKSLLRHRENGVGAFVICNLAEQFLEIIKLLHRHPNICELIGPGVMQNMFHQRAIRSCRSRKDTRV